MKTYFPILFSDLNYPLPAPSTGTNIYRIPSNYPKSTHYRISAKPVFQGDIDTSYKIIRKYTRKIGLTESILH